MSLVATLLCISLILYLFKTEEFRGSEAPPSKALWLPLIWFLLCSCRSPSMWIYGIGPDMVADADFLEGNTLDRNIYFLLILLGLYVLMRRMVNWGEFVRNNPIVFIFIGYCLISFLWADFPMQTIRRWIKGGLGNMVMILVVLTEESPASALRSLYFRAAYLMAPLSMLTMKFYPHLGRAFDRSSGNVMYIGLAYGKNLMGVINLVCGIAIFWDILNRMTNSEGAKYGLAFWSRVFLMGVIILSFTMVHSSTSLLSFIICIVVVLSLNLPFVKNNLQKISLYVVSAGILYFILELSLGITTKIILALGKDVSLTGRDVIWRDVLMEKFNRVLGAGYESYWAGQRLLNLWEKHWWHPKQAHNGYLETYLNLGAVGVVLLVLLLLSCYRKSTKSLNDEFRIGRFRLAILVICLAYNITEAAFNFLHPLWFSLLVFCSMLPIANKRESIIRIGTG